MIRIRKSVFKPIKNVSYSFLDFSLQVIIGSISIYVRYLLDFMADKWSVILSLASIGYFKCFVFQYLFEICCILAKKSCFIKVDWYILNCFVQGCYSVDFIETVISLFSAWTIFFAKFVHLLSLKENTVLKKWHFLYFQNIWRHKSKIFFLNFAFVTSEDQNQPILIHSQIRVLSKCCFFFQITPQNNEILARIQRRIYTN